MTDDLDTLRLEVREAVKNFDDLLGGFGDVREFRWQTIRAELLRLTDDCARLVDCINAQPPTRRSLIDRAERAEAELAAAQNTIDAQQDTMGALKRKLALSEGELAALKARMKPCARVRDGEVHVYMDTAHEGKEVAVVVVEE